MRILVFEIRKPDIHIIFQCVDRFDSFISAAVIDHRNPKLVPDEFKSIYNQGKVLGGSDQVYVVGLLILKTEKNICQCLDRQLFPCRTLADEMILAKAAAQGASAEKYGSASMDSADTWFFPMMQGSPCCSHNGCAAAAAGRDSPVNPTGSWT